MLNHNLNERSFVEGMQANEEQKKNEPCRSGNCMGGQPGI